MSIFSDLVGTIKSAVGANSDAKPVQKPELLVYLTGLEEEARLMKSVLSDSSVTEDLFPAHQGLAVHPSVKLAQAAYKKYVSLLSGTVKEDEVRKPFSTMLETLDLVIRNLDEVQDNFLKIFNEKTNDVETDNLQLSQVMFAGYMARSDRFLDWLQLFLMHATPTDDSSIAPYRTKAMNDYVADIASFVMISLRNEKLTLVKQIEDMRRSGRDLFISTDGQTIDQYASDRILTPNDMDLVKEAMRNPIAMFISWREGRRQNAIEKLRSRVGWLRAKTTQQAMRLNNADPNSQEYKDAERLLSRYADEMAKYDKKLQETIG